MLSQTCSYRKCHQLLERHAVVGVDVKQSLRDGREPEPLLHHIDGDEEDGRDIFLGTTLLAQRLKCPKLVEGMKCDTMHVFGERVFFRGDLGAIADDARDRRGLRQALLLRQKLKCT